MRLARITKNLKKKKKSPTKVNLLDFEQLKNRYCSSSSCMKVGLGPTALDKVRL